MKKKIVILLVALFSFVLLCGFENDRDFEISVGEGYSYCYSDSSFDSVTARLNEIYALTNSGEQTDVYDNTKLKSYFENNDIRFFAVSNTDASQIRVAVYSDEISEMIGDLSLNSESRIKDFAKDLVGENDLTYEIYQRDAKKYIMLTARESDSGGSYIATQFITVCNGKVFNISFFNQSGVTDAEKKILDTFEIKETNFAPKTPVFVVILIAIGIALLTCLIIYMVWGLVHKKKKPATDDEALTQDEETQDKKEDQIKK